ncbi:MAG: SDR family NAD(P)-dependent oxidoreductase [Armatimonadetes bacterium]|nr:SDR family NAD(P)-dependent oxidoreductase [Armatimonadota bacterium]
MPHPKVVLISGAGGALGSAVAARYRQHGSRLALAVFSESEYQEGAFCRAFDAANVQEADSFVKDAVGELGSIDALINCVGGFEGGQPIAETEEAVWDKMMAMNAKSVFALCRAVAPVMAKQGHGKIVNFGARPALQSPAGMAAYAASKAAVLRITESLSAELKSKGVNVNAILPSTLDTPGNRAAMPNADASKWVALDAMVDVVEFLCSDASRAIHGAAIPVYGLG